MPALIAALEGMLGTWLTQFLLGFTALAALITLNAMFMVWFERKVSAWVQGRLGPMEHGPQGTLQTLLDVIKLLGKEPIIPAKVDRTTFILAPVVAFLPALVLLSLLPYSEDLVFTNAESGILLVFAFGGVSLMGVFMGGWSSNNKYALLGGVRAVSQNIAYELPLLLSTMAVVLSAGTLNISKIVQVQTAGGFGWFFMYQPLALIIYIIAATAETNRAPFDIPEAESELVAGFHTEYPAMGFAVFFLAEYTYMFVVCGVGAALFLGGNHGPWLPGPCWFLIKVYFLLFLMVMFRWTFPRLRFDQLMDLAWKLLIPLSLANLMVTALVIKLV
ncbi:MAG: NADH-quinone oxidoreductase subunit NuoH [Rickettsiales bacterium]|nr:NADH-quinone oxidoreductase subunit NuoH [Rickettsiales bacterium]|tara:strand:+ start:665 stop:1660 length:996 start_codon:yes stop_codon:yes gene_type:complete